MSRRSVSGRDVSGPRPSPLPLLVTIAALAFAASLAFGALKPERDRLGAMRRERHERETQLERLRARAADLEVRCETLESDPHLVERLIRDEYGYARPGETIVDPRDPAGPTDWPDEARPPPDR